MVRPSLRPPLTPFVDALPLPRRILADHHGGKLTVPIRAATHRFHRDLPTSRVWAYDGRVPGPTIEAERGRPVRVHWRNPWPRPGHGPAFHGGESPMPLGHGLHQARDQLTQPARPCPAQRADHCPGGVANLRSAPPPGRDWPLGLDVLGRSVESLAPVLGHGAGWAGCRLVFGVVAGRGELRTGGVLVGLEVPEPVLARLEALHVAMVGRVEVGPRVLARR